MSVAKRLGDWFDRRTGWRGMRAEAVAGLAKPVPPRVGWGFTLGSTALGLLFLQVATGVALALHYQPTPEAAHGSVARIMDEVRLGWVVRGMHVWGAHALVALVLAHAAKVFVTGGHKRPRELTWILGAGVMFVMLGLAFTGHLLPWTDQSYWGAVVGVEQTRIVPVVGPPTATLLLGGETVAAPTLTRFYVLHLLILPAILAKLLFLHLWLVRRHGVSPAESADEEDARGHAALCAGGEPYAPNHMLREAIAVAVAAAAVLTAAALWPQELGPRAGASTPEGVRPEWYFLAVYQYLKYWPSQLLGLPGETIGICLLSAALGAFVFLPFLDRSPERRPARRRVALVAGALAVLLWGTLTALGAVSDRSIPAFGKTWTFDTWGRPR
ncbi:MAG: cytochrome bc complex cytochrome b subunit [Candidatus Brocadiae bacterium]|nr:cytochrome bc complex cytochrome b subunit [Candidatus Brocadiia bacterium]